MLDGVMLLRFLFTALSLLFVVIDIRTSPASPSAIDNRCRREVSIPQ
jgi:hypothetical protein